MIDRIPRVIRFLCLLTALTVLPSVSIFPRTPSDTDTDPPLVPIVNGHWMIYVPLAKNLPAAGTDRGRRTIYVPDGVNFQ